MLKSESESSVTMLFSLMGPLAAAGQIPAQPGVASLNLSWAESAPLEPAEETDPSWARSNVVRDQRSGRLLAYSPVVFVAPGGGCDGQESLAPAAEGPAHPRWCPHPEQPPWATTLPVSWPVTLELSATDPLLRRQQLNAHLAVLAAEGRPLDAVWRSWHYWGGETDPPEPPAAEALAEALPEPAWLHNPLEGLLPGMMSSQQLHDASHWVHQDLAFAAGLEPGLELEVGTLTLGNQSCALLGRSGELRLSAECEALLSAESSEPAAGELRLFFLPGSSQTPMLRSPLQLVRQDQIRLPSWIPFKPYVAVAAPVLIVLGLIFPPLIPLWMAIYLRSRRTRLWGLELGMLWRQRTSKPIQSTLEALASGKPPVVWGRSVRLISLTTPRGRSRFRRREGIEDHYVTHLGESWVALQAGEATPEQEESCVQHMLVMLIRKAPRRPEAVHAVLTAFQQTLCEGSAGEPAALAGLILRQVQSTRQTDDLSQPAAFAEPEGPSGQLRIGSQPAGLAVVVDGRPAGRTPLSLSLPADRSHQIEVLPAQSSTHHIAQAQLSLAPDEDRELVLSPEPRAARLRVTCGGERHPVRVSLPDGTVHTGHSPDLDLVVPPTVEILVEVFPPDDPLWTTGWRKLQVGPGEVRLLADLLPRRRQGLLVLSASDHEGGSLELPIRIDGQAHGQTPARLSVLIGPHQVEVGPLQQKLLIEEAQTHELCYQQPPPLDPALVQQIELVQGVGGLLRFVREEALDPLRSLAREWQQLTELGARMRALALAENTVSRAYLEDWHKLLEPQHSANIQLVCGSLDLVFEAQLLGRDWQELVREPRFADRFTGAGAQDLARAWRELMPAAQPVSRSAGPQLVDDLCQHWVHTLLVPFVRLVQFIFEALPQELPAVGRQAVKEGHTLGIGDYQAHLVRLAQVLDYEYDHIQLYERSDSDFDYRNNVHCVGVSVSEGLHGVVPSTHPVGLIYRVPDPLFLPRNNRYIATDARTWIFRREHA